jgi:hypothetical protein
MKREREEGGQQVKEEESGKRKDEGEIKTEIMKYT